MSERVQVRGRDEFAALGRSFNEMAEQLEARVGELEEERRRLREATIRFGEALGATHDVAQLRRVVVETAVEAAGAQSGALITSDGSSTEAGTPGLGEDRLEVPIVVRGRPLGRLVLTGPGFGAEGREAAMLLAGQAGVALDNARLHEIVEAQAKLDELTGLANRRRVEELLGVELARAGRLDAPLTLVLADLDGFKGINDRYGHPTGDAVLSEFAGVLLANVREIDHAGRWGGEEFAILLPGTDLGGGEQVAERLRTELAGRTIHGPNGESFSVTCSFGLASFPGETTAAGLIAAADAALYEAKRSGRNRVVASAGDAVRP